MKKIVLLVICTLLAVTAAAPSFSHHAVNAQFDPQKTVEITGVLTKFRMINPHPYFYIDVKDEEGNVVNWGVESIAPTALARAGIPVRTAFQIGETYTLWVHPARNGSSNGLMTVIQLLDGTVVAAGTGGSIRDADFDSKN